MTEALIQAALMGKLRSGYQCFCTNFTPGLWWECDLWGVTRSGYVVEFEIKLSAADFRADRGKQVTSYNRSAGEWVLRRKHEMLRDGLGVPSRFYFVMPRDLEASVGTKVPPWAGVIYAVQHGDRWVSVDCARKAPQLHRRRVSDGEIGRAMTSLWDRHWRALEEISRLRTRLGALGGGF